jgi:hypothetical protein
LKSRLATVSFVVVTSFPTDDHASAKIASPAENIYSYSLVTQYALVYISTREKKKSLVRYDACKKFLVLGVTTRSTTELEIHRAGNDFQKRAARQERARETEKAEAGAEKVLAEVFRDPGKSGTLH